MLHLNHLHCLLLCFAESTEYVWQRGTIDDTLHQSGPTEELLQSTNIVVHISHLENYKVCMFMCCVYVCIVLYVYIVLYICMYVCIVLYICMYVCIVCMCNNHM